MKRKNVLITISLALLICLSAMIGFIAGTNSNHTNKTFKGIVGSNNISINIANTQRMPSGTAYSIIMKNTSAYIIKQNAVYISYPITHSNYQTMNKCKTEATGNKLDLKPDEEIRLNVFIPIENYENNKNLDITRPQYEIKGYFGEVNAMYHFEQSGGFSKEESAQ